MQPFWNSLSIADRQELLTVRISDLADRAKEETEFQERNLASGEPLSIVGLDLYFLHGIHPIRRHCKGVFGQTVVNGPI